MAVVGGSPAGVTAVSALGDVSHIYAASPPVQRCRLSGAGVCITPGIRPRIVPPCDAAPRTSSRCRRACRCEKTDQGSQSVLPDEIVTHASGVERRNAEWYASSSWPMPRVGAQADLPQTD